MRFKNYGKTRQLVVESHKDLPDVLKLDESLWAVTSAPTSAYKCDIAFLKYVDSDNNNRIRTDEVKAIIAWYMNILSDFSGCNTQDESININQINKESTDAQSLLMSAGYILEHITDSEGIITLKKVRENMNELRMRPLNGDGVIIPESTNSKNLSEYISAAITSTGGTADLSGKIGISKEQLDAFRNAIPAYLNWLKRGALEHDEIMPLGTDSNTAWLLLEKHRAAIDTFFILAHFKGFDPDNAQKYINANKDAATLDVALDSAPIARPDENGNLPIYGSNVNPLCRDTLINLHDNLFAKVLGEKLKTLTEENWNKIKSVLAPYGAYLNSKQGGIVESFPVETLEAWNNPNYTNEIEKLIEKDKEVAFRVSAFNKLEKLILCHKYLVRLVNNFVNLSDFYDANLRSMFERGSAVIDGRWFKLAIETDNPTTHSVTAKESGLFTFYLKIETRNAEQPQKIVVIPATAGTIGNLAVGKRGIFFDVNDVEYDATIVQIIENPISLREAMLAPFIKVGKMIMGKIEGLSSNAEETIMKNADKATTIPPSGSTSPPPPASSPANILLSASVSIAALGSGFAFFAKSFGTMSVTGRIYTALSAVVIILAPIFIVGFIKLAKQDISAIFEGCGWAVNQRMRLTRRLRRQFTERKPYPKNER